MIKAAAQASTGHAGPHPGTEAKRAPPQIPDHTLIRRIGRGSYGEVWLGQNVMGTYRAIKVVYRQSFDDDRPFQREFQGIQKFEPISRSHHGLMDILQVGQNEADQSFYYVMELADDAAGESEQIPPAHFPTFSPSTYQPRTLRRVSSQRGCLPPSECVSLALALTDALGALHRNGLVHRDIKPSNIIFVNGVPKLADIGLVTDIDATYTYVGTEGFIAPEGPGTPPADLYSLGKVLYEISTGKDRHEFPDLPTAMGTSADRVELLELNEVLLKACATDSRKRYQKAEQMHADMALLRSGKSIRHLRVVERRLARARTAGLIAACVAVIAALAGLLFAHQARVERDSRQRIQEAEQSARQESYSRAMLLAHEAVQANNFGGVRELLEQTRSFAASIGSTNRMRRPAPVGRPPAPRYEGPDESAFVLTRCDSGVRAMAVSPDGQWLAAGEENGKVTLWNLSDCQLRQQWQVAKANVERLAFSPESQRLAVGCSDGWVATFVVPSGELIAEYREESRILDMRFSTDGRCLRDCSTHGLGVHDFAVASDSPKIGNIGALSAAISPDFAMLVSSHLGYVVWHWFNPYTNVVFQALVGTTSAISPDSRWLAIGVGDSSIEIWSLAEKRRVRELIGHTAAVQTLAWSADSRLLASGGFDRTVAVWDAEQGALLRQMRGHQDDVNTLAFSPDGRTLYSGSDDQTIRAWTDWESVRGPNQPDVGLTERPDAPSSARRDHEAEVGRARLSQRAGAGPIPNGALGQTRPTQFSESRPQHSEFLDAASKTSNAVRRKLPWEWRHLQYECRDEAVSVLAHCADDVPAVAVSPDGHWLAAGVGNGQVLLWDLFARKLSREWQVAKASVECLAFSPDARRLAVGCIDGWVGTLAIPSGEVVAEFREPSGILDLRFWADSRSLSYCSADTFGSRDFSGAQHSLSLRNLGYVGRAAIGDNLLALSATGLALYWGNPAWTNVVFPDSDTNWENSALAISPDGRWLAMGLGDSSIEVWSLAEKQPVRRLRGHRRSVRSLAWSADSRLLASGSYDQTVVVWDPHRGTLLRRVRGHRAHVATLAFAPDSRTLYSGSYDQTVRAWTDLEAPPVLDEIALPSRPLWAACLAPGARFAYGFGTNAIWSLKLGPAPSLPSLQPAPSFGLAISPDGRWLVSLPGTDDGVGLWRFKSDRFVPFSTHHASGRTTKMLAFSPDGQRVALLSTNEVLTLWDFKSWQQLAHWDGVEHLMSSLLFDPAGRRIFVRCEDFGACAAEIETGRLIQIPKDKKSGVSGIAISPDNRLVALAHNNGTVMLWEYAPGDEPRNLGTVITEHDNICSVAFSPDGQRLAIGLDTGDIHIWDVQHRMRVGILNGHRRRVWELGFNPDDDSLISISPDELRVWRVADGD